MGALTTRMVFWGRVNCKCIEATRRYYGWGFIRALGVGGYPSKTRGAGQAVLFFSMLLLVQQP